MFQLKYRNLFSDFNMWMFKAYLLGITLGSCATLKGIIPGVVVKIAKSPSLFSLSNNASTHFFLLRHIYDGIIFIYVLEISFTSNASCGAAMRICLCEDTKTFSGQDKVMKKSISTKIKYNL